MRIPRDWFSEPRLLVLLQIVFVVCATLYSVMTPLFEMSDELWHYPMVKTLADGNGLPVQDPANPGPWKQEGSQPPLYYYLAALSTSWIDTSDVGEVLRPNPHVDNGVVTLDGNNNLVVHNYRREAWPWRGSVLAVHIARLLSVFSGAGAVYFTYRIGQQVFPEKHWLALGGAAAVGFTPMFAFISGAVNNDSLAAMLSALAVWLMLAVVSKAEAGHSTWRWSATLGITLGLAALTKTSTLGLFGLAGLSLAVAAWRAKRWQVFFLEGPLIIVIALLIAGWWYYRNLTLYGDPLGLNTFIAILGRRSRPASLLQLWGERLGFMQSYWGLFGGVNIPMPAWTYDTLNVLAIASVGGVVASLIQRLRRSNMSLRTWYPVVLTFLWIAGVVVPLALSWARITWSSQGRLVFSAISCISLWFMAGLGDLLPDRWGKLTTGAVLALMAGLTFAAPFAWIAPRYRAPAQLAEQSDTYIAEFSPREASSAALRLISYDIREAEVHPGDWVQVSLSWETLTRMDRNWSTFIHLEDSVQLLAGQRDTYPGLGLLATRDLEPGYRWTDTYLVPVNSGAYAPETLRATVGLYDWNTCTADVSLCERMVTSDGEEAVELGTIKLLPRSSGGNLPNPVHVNFGSEIMLAGYELSPRSAHAGDILTLRLYWQGLQRMDINYTISAQILGLETRIFGQKDSWPLDGVLPTSTWTPGLVVEDTMAIPVNADTPPAVYNIQVVVYSAESGVVERLQRVTEDGRLIEDYVLLTQVRIVP